MVGFRSQLPHFQEDTWVAVVAGMGMEVGVGVDGGVLKGHSGNTLAARWDAYESFSVVSPVLKTVITNNQGGRGGGHWHGQGGGGPGYEGWGHPPSSQGGRGGWAGGQVT